MALIKCPECGRDLSDQASSCPHCGHPLAPPIAAAPASNRLDAQVRDVLAREGKIAAIKFYREQTPGVGLAEAKGYVERLEGGAPGPRGTTIGVETSLPKKGGCANLVLFLVLIVIGVTLILLLVSR